MPKIIDGRHAGRVPAIDCRGAGCASLDRSRGATVGDEQPPEGDVTSLTRLGAAVETPLRELGRPFVGELGGQEPSAVPADSSLISPLFLVPLAVEMAAGARGSGCHYWLSCSSATGVPHPCLGCHDEVWTPSKQHDERTPFGRRQCRF